MRLIFIRHPETQANVKGLIYGRSESDYSDMGKASVSWVVEQMKELDFDVIYASPLKRTAYLAEQIAKDHDADGIIFEDRLMEMHCGIFENMSNSDAREKYKDEYESLINNYNRYVIPQGESFEMVYHRVVTFLKETFKNHPAEQTIVFVAHSMVILAALAYLLQIELDDIWHIKINPAAIVDVHYEAEFGMLQGLKAPIK